MTIWLFCIIIYLRWPLLSYWNTSSSFSQVRKKLRLIFVCFFFELRKNILYFLGRNRVGHTVKKLVNRFKREENDVFQNNRNTLIKRVNFFLIELKLLYIRKFVQTMDTIFFLFAYIYIYITYKGNMKFARLNPDVRTMLQLDQI